MLEFTLGVLRLGIPLFGITLAAALYYRTAVLNVAIDGQVQAGAIAYVGGALIGGWPVGILFGIFASTIPGLLLVFVTIRYYARDLLVGLGMLYSLVAGAMVASSLFFSSPGHALLAESRMGVYASVSAGAILIFVFFLADRFWTPLRVSKVFSDAEALARLQGLTRLHFAMVHALIGGLLIAFASVTLVELGGGFSAGLGASGRGFIGLAIVAVVRHSFLGALLFVAIVSVMQQIVLTGSLPSRYGNLGEAAIYLTIVLLLFLRGALFERARDRTDSFIAAGRLPRTFTGPH